jgi:hypothetical protein
MVGLQTRVALKNISRASSIYQSPSSRVLMADSLAASNFPGVVQLLKQTLKCWTQVSASHQWHLWPHCFPCSHQPGHEWEGPTQTPKAGVWPQLLHMWYGLMIPASCGADGTLDVKVLCEEGVVLIATAWLTTAPRMHSSVLWSS